jgi:hypothetical protein
MQAEQLMDKLLQVIFAVRERMGHGHPWQSGAKAKYSK